ASATRAPIANAYEYSPVPAGPKSRAIATNRKKLKRSASTRETESHTALLIVRTGSSTWIGGLERNPSNIDQFRSASVALPHRHALRAGCAAKPCGGDRRSLAHAVSAGFSAV